MFKNPRGQVRAGWLIAFALVMVFIGQAMFMLPGMTMMALVEISKDQMELSIDMMNANPWMVLLTQGAGTLGGIAATLVVFRAINKKNPNKLGLQGRFTDLIFGLLLGALSMTFIFFILQATDQIFVLNKLSAPIFSTFTWVYLVIFILVGFFEEMFFRGYVIQTMLERRNRKWVIYVVSAVVFGIVHLSNPSVSIIGILNIILVGLLFAYMFDTTKSLLLPVGYHITWNFFQGSVYGFPVSGLKPAGLYLTDTTVGNPFITGGAFGIEGGLMATIFIILSFIATYLYSGKRTPLLKG